MTKPKASVVTTGSPTPRMVTVHVAFEIDQRSLPLSAEHAAIYAEACAEQIIRHLTKPTSEDNTR